MILIDSSVWIDLLRGQRTRGATELRRLVQTHPERAAVTEPIGMELLAGASGEDDVVKLEQLIASMVLLPVEPTVDFHDAAQLYRVARARGHTVPTLADCLIATIAIRHAAELWHKDADFEAIAEVTALRTLDLR